MKQADQPKPQRIEFDPDYPDDIDAAERARREVLRKRIAAYFQERVKSDPAVTEAGKLASLLGKYQDGERTLSLSKEVYKPNIDYLEGVSPGALSSKLCELGHYYPGGAHSALFAIYEDGTLLWLDDHTSNQEFDTFLRREQIRWQNADEAAEFMMQTKFHYLPEPGRMRIVSKVEDIPQQMLEEPPQNDRDVAWVNEYKKRLDDVAPQIYPPQLTVENGVIDLQFCVWLNVFGMLYSIKCHFDIDSRLSYKSDLLGGGLGDAFAPR